MFIKDLLYKVTEKSPRYREFFFYIYIYIFYKIYMKYQYFIGQIYSSFSFLIFSIILRRGEICSLFIIIGIFLNFKSLIFANRFLPFNISTIPYGNTSTNGGWSILIFIKSLRELIYLLFCLISSNLRLK